MYVSIKTMKKQNTDGANRNRKKKKVDQEVISKNNSRSRQFDQGILSDYQGRSDFNAF